MDSSKENHLTLTCQIHNLKQSKICVEKSCCLFLMCQKCVEAHLAEKNTHKLSIKEFGDVIDPEKIYKQVENLEKDKYSQEYMLYKAQNIIDQVKSLMGAIKKSFIENIEAAEKEIYVKINDYCCLKNVYDPDSWNHLLDEYDEKLKYFIHSPPGIFTKEYVDFLSIFKDINEKLGSIEYMRTVMGKIKIEDLGNYMVSLESYTKSLEKDILDIGKRAIRPIYPLSLEDIELGDVVESNHNSIISAYEYLEDFNWIVTGNQKGAITFWDASNFSLLSTEVVHRGEITNILYVPDKNIIISASKNSVIKIIGIKFRELEVRNPIVLPEAHKGLISCLCYLDGLNKFVSYGEDQLINFWDLESNEFHFNIDTDKWAPCGFQMAYIKKHKLLVIPGKKSFRIYNAENGDLFYSETLNCAPNSLEYLEESGKIITQKESGKIGIWQLRADVSIGYERDIQLPKKGIGFIKTIEQMDALFFTTDSGYLLIFKLSTGSCLRQIELQLKKPSCIIPIVGMRRILVGDSASENLQFVEL